MRAYQSIPAFLMTAALALSGCGSHTRPATRAPAGPDFAEARTPTTEPAPLAASEGTRPIPPDDQLFFAFDSDKLDQDGRTLLGEVARWVKADPRREVLVQGHADHAGDTDYNLDLSSRRAHSVASYLQALGVSPIRITVVAVGETQAIIRPAPANRRVVIFANTMPETAQATYR
jgi:outer membrane protein OmpA-like peptidoglycan-associated protein